VFVKDNTQYASGANDRSKSTLRIWLVNMIRIAKSLKFWAVSLIGGFLFIPINVLATMWGVEFIEQKLRTSQAYAANINSLLFIGNIIGCLIVSIIAPYTKRYRAILLFSSCCLFIISIAVIYVPLPNPIFISFILMMGIMAGPELLVFDIGRMIAPQALTATAVAGVNLVNNLLAAILLPLIGLIITFINVSHNAIIKHAANEVAFLVIPVSILLCIPLCYLLPKECK
jgi:cyanate permease